MMRAAFAFLAVAALGVGAAALAFAADEETEAKAAAEKQATAWVELLDTGKYAVSWTQAGASFQEALLQEKWVTMAAKARDPLGKVLSRAVSKSEYTESLPGAPDGKYVVVEFTTSFEQKKSGAETAIMSLEKDGAWRAVGYFIK